MNLQPVFDLAQLCHLRGIKHAIISPGSRNAALTIAFARHPEIQCYSIPDERSAAFIGLGMSLKTQVPTVLICTSGSAALNYAPAIAEAYFNQVPLLILTADRPPEWIGQRDGQTIFQENVFGRHVKKSYVYPSLEEDEGIVQNGHKMINQAIDQCFNEMGPVHINIPFREPFYPKPDRSYTYSASLSSAPEALETNKNWKTQLDDINQFNRILLIVGQDRKNDELSKQLSHLSREYNIPIVADIISNAHDTEGVIDRQDVFLKGLDNDSLRPDLLITIGKSVISKNLKLYLRKFKPKAHWHIRNESYAPDTYKCLNKHIKGDEVEALVHIQNRLGNNDSQRDFQSKWKAINQVCQQHIDQYKSTNFSEINGYKKVLDMLPSGSDLHLANSMAVRYANVVGLQAGKIIEIFCNRGTSGIDGSNSTAVGTSLTTNKPTFLITGDLAFLYDRNAFWHNHLPNNLSIIIFNNHGGGIFRMIEGPSQQPELEEFFETRQQQDAALLAKEFGFDYLPCRDEIELDESLTSFYQTGNRKILEIFTGAEESKQAYKELFRSLPR